MTKLSLATLCSLIGILTTTVAPAGDGGNMGSGGGSDVQSVAEREIARRQEYARRSEEYIAAGDKAMREKDYETAISNYRTVCDMLPESEATHEIRQHALKGFCDASVALAKQRIAEGRYGDAQTTLKIVIDPKYCPDCRDAVAILAHLEDPQYYNKTITPQFHANVEQVKQWFIDADGFFGTGRFDLAYKRYEQILNVDPYNIAARKGQERVNFARDNYNIAGYDQTRSKLLWQLGKAWDSPVKKYNLKNNTIVSMNAQPERSTIAIENKLNRIIIPKIEFREATIREAIDFLKQKSRDLDPDPDPAHRGVNIVLKLEGSPGAPAALPTEPAPGGVPGLTPEPAGGVSVNPSDVRITLSLSNVPMMEALKYITNLANLKIKIDPYAVAVVPFTEVTDTLITKEYKVPPGFIPQQASAGGGASGLATVTPGAGGAADASKGGSGITGKMKARDFLEANGILFPTGASANYLPQSSRLVVHNTQANLDLVDALVEASNVLPTQVEIESKFVEITQNNLKELSFDWLLGQFNAPGSDRVFGGGGTAGLSQAVNNADYPFVAPGAANPIGKYPLTAGNRSGNLAISANAIDALLFPTKGASTLAPSVFGVAGVFTDPQFQLVVRALNQKKGVDLLSAPRVTTKSGQRAVIEIIREFRYPTEFDPPQIPQQFGGGGSGSGTTVITSFPVTPTTPTAFETRNTGVTLEVEPTVASDGTMIDLNLVPQVVEFEGFINYGSPINTVTPPSIGIGGILIGGGAPVVLTENVINQPIFSTRKVTTSVSIWDGQTVVIGGLMREDVQKTEDKVPLLGDIPLAGRLFRSQVDQHLKRNLIIFVTARLINPAGDTILQDEENEEVVEPLAQPETLMPPPMPESGFRK